MLSISSITAPFYLKVVICLSCLLLLYPLWFFCSAVPLHLLVPIHQPPQLQAQTTVFIVITLHFPHLRCPAVTVTASPIRHTHHLSMRHMRHVRQLFCTAALSGIAHVIMPLRYPDWSNTIQPIPAHGASLAQSIAVPSPRKRRLRAGHVSMMIGPGLAEPTAIGRHSTNHQQARTSSS